MCNVCNGCFNQLYSAIGVKAPNIQMLQLQCGSQVNPIAGYLTSPDNTTVHIELPIVTMLVDRISSVVLRGVSHEGRLIGRGARNQEQEGNKDTRVRQVWAVSMT